MNRTDDRTREPIRPPVTPTASRFKGSGRHLPARGAHPSRGRK